MTSSKFCKNFGSTSGKNDYKLFLGESLVIFRINFGG